jgi:hypothetical protein
MSFNTSYVKLIRNEILHVKFRTQQSCGTIVRIVLVGLNLKIPVNTTLYFTLIDVWATLYVRTENEKLGMT